MWQGRPEKEKIRETIVKYAGRKTVKSALCLPGIDCADVKLFVERGIFNPKTTRLVVVEKNPDYHITIKRKLRAMGFKHLYFHGDDLHKLRVDRYMDFVSIDLMGALSAEIAYWVMTEMLPHVDEKTTIVFTVTENADRGSTPTSKSFMHKCQYEITQHYYDMVEDFRKKQPHATTSQITPLVLISNLLMHWGINNPIIKRYSDTPTPMLNYIFSLKRRKSIHNCGKLVDILSEHTLVCPSKRSLPKKVGRD